MRLIGLSGGIATGKSTVSKIVSQEGIPVVDCDKIAHAVVKKVSHSPLHTIASDWTSILLYVKALILILRVQGRWGYKRVLAAFGDGVLQADGMQVMQSHDGLSRLPTNGQIYENVA
jgi:dephospho-CoA kinase